MRGASRASLAAAVERLSAVAHDADTAARMGVEFLAVVGFLDGQPALRRTLSDPSQHPEAKTGIVRALFEERLSADTLRLLTELVTARWSAPGDLTDAIEELAVRAIVAAADQEGQLDDLEDELFRFGRIVRGQPELRIALSNPFAPADGKRELVQTLLANRVTQATLLLVTQAAVHPRGRSLDESLEEFARLAAERRERLVAEVHVPAELTAEQRGRLAAALAAIYGHDVHLNIVLDPQVIGGMSIRVGDELIDGSVASRLAELRRRLAA